MNSVSKVKIAVGYTLLLAVLFFSLFFVHREMENLILTDDRDVQWTDSVLALIREKDTNTIRMLRTLSEANDSMVSTSDIEQIIAQQDSVVTQQRVQHRIITHRDTVVTRPRKKGFFRRLGEVFVPPKKDTAIQVKTSLEFATDTVIEPYNPADSLHEKLRAVAQQKKAVNTVIQRRKRYLQRLDHMLTARIDSLLKDYETETLLRARTEAEYQQAVRRRSAKIISGIAVGAVLLSAFFLIIIGRDITRSNRYRRELEEARRRAEDLLAVREKLMLAITHDFKAPLGSIMGYADLLSRLTVDERQRFYLDNMKTSSEHLLKLVGTYICYPLRLRQIINNLLSNAVKFTDQGSITMTARYEDRRLVVAIADTGRGMEPADRERIFQEFTRLPGAQGKEGFGLGLSFVRMVVQLLEGTIDVDSVPGKGSTFTIYIPIYPVRSEGRRMKDEESGCVTTPNGNSSFPVPHSSLKNVLLIDDDRIQLTLTAAMLQQSGINSVSCLQLDELLDALRTATFDVLLTDVQMPAINGFDLLKLLRASNIPQAQSVPVIAVTARSDMQREEFTAHGFAGCLHKPFTVSELLHELNVEDKGKEVTEVSEASACPGYKFSSLTVFSVDDPEAAKSILESFVAETRLNAERLQKAVENEDVDEMAAVSHKMIPLFTLIGATELVALLKLLETSHGVPFTGELKEHALAALVLIEDVITQATAFP